MSDKSIVRQHWERHKKAREDLLAGYIADVNHWISLTHDPDAGDIGRRFMKEVEDSGCAEEVDIFFTKSTAVYTSFSLSKDGPAFPNVITYGPQAEANTARLFQNMVHEKTHAQQMARTAALHASPFNPKSKVMLCPRDYAMIMARAEQHAYVMQALFGSNTPEDIREDMRHFARLDTLCIRTFEDIRGSSASMQDALVQAARVALTKDYRKPYDGRSFEDYYHGNSLDGYKIGLELRHKRDEKDFVFVRLEEEDIRTLGDLLGYNIFGSTAVLPEFMNANIPHEDNAKKLAALNELCGITDESSLLTLSQGLAIFGQNRQDFMAMVKPATVIQRAIPDAAPRYAPAP